MPRISWAPKFMVVHMRTTIGAISVPTTRRAEFCRLGFERTPRAISLPIKARTLPRKHGATKCVTTRTQGKMRYAERYRLIEMGQKYCRVESVASLRSDMQLARGAAWLAMQSTYESIP